MKTTLDIFGPFSRLAVRPEIKELRAEQKSTHFLLGYLAPHGRIQGCGKAAALCSSCWIHVHGNWPKSKSSAGMA